MKPLETRLTPEFRRVAAMMLAAVLFFFTLVVLYQVMPVSWSVSLHEMTGKSVVSTQSCSSPPSNHSAASASTSTLPFIDDFLHPDRRCQALPDPGNMLFIVKTGATEIYEKLPTQLLTTLGCSRDFIIFSDLQEQIGPYTIHDALADFNASMKATHPEFELYRQQQEYQRGGLDIATLKHDGQAAWKLDKYKFLHVVEKTWAQRPNVDWYVFIESDTYVVWTNLLLWLKQLSPRDRLYMGSAAFLGSQGFGHGGSGYIISKALMEKFVGQNPGMASRYDEVFSDVCCGDFVLGKTLTEELNIKIQNFWPQVNGEKPVTLEFGSRQWCQPVVTMHHVMPRERSAIFDFEQARDDVTKPLLFRELSELSFPPGKMRVQEDDWDNLANKKVDLPQPSMETCRDQCLQSSDCFQWRFSGDECHVLTEAFKLGTKKLPENTRRWFSGWNVRKIQDWRDTHPCDKPAWEKAH
ncbi:glycosyltransferase family 31 protein [Aspergillus clavatus NRRL 1]|uniref:Glycosyltransferase family 31 protein n=1 Tax=Aspergillus clavatus (strain ATCC 1007 / CBS 513.65 / DSM 816 / NCTC 3887 / NRRL 1 / QM 1276 / 107) TaxID=344612 RepID=A1C858_ASPCL|nr:uncharacterized protein ACLA_076190 [Aspergillus clavatus NRRL 1]EAW14579.1 conserved hypothetical protein [Aspergillus clavatus NRRL 1]